MTDSVCSALSRGANGEQVGAGRNPDESAAAAYAHTTPVTSLQVRKRISIVERSWSDTRPPRAGDGEDGRDCRRG